MHLSSSAICVSETAFLFFVVATQFASWQGTRSVYFPQRCMNKPGLLGYAGPANNNCIIALQVETADCIRNVSMEGSLLFVSGCC